MFLTEKKLKYINIYMNKYNSTLVDKIKYNRINFQYLRNSLINIPTYFLVYYKGISELTTLQYDVYDNIAPINPKYYSWILLPKDNYDLITNFRMPYLKIYRNVKPHTSFPPIEDVMTLFRNNENHRIIHPKMNALLLSFAGYFAHIFFQTWYNEKNIPYQNYRNDLTAAPIYGTTIEMENVVRKHKNGKIRMRKDKTPLHISDLTVEEAKLFNMTNPNKNPELFVCGISRANVSIGTYLFHTLFQRNHNRICKLIKKVNSGFDDETMFQLAKTINLYHMINIVMYEYVPFLVNIPILSDNFRDFTSPYSLSKLSRGIESGRTVPFDYNLIYQWHLALPDKIGKHSLQKIAYNTDILYKNNMAEIVDKLQDTKCYTQHIVNCQSYLEPAEQKAIQVSRNINMLTYCEYRKKIGYPIPKTFRDITQEDYFSERLKQVYKKVENVDCYVGINSEPTGFFIFPEVISYTLGGFAIGGLTNNFTNYRLFIENYDIRLLSIVNDFTFEDFFHKNFSENEKFKSSRKVSFQYK